MSAEALDSRGRHRVAITGLGVKTPAGSTIDAFWSYLLSGKSAGAIIKCFDPSELSMRFACEVTDFDPADYLGPKEIRRVDRVVHLGLAAAVDAFADAGSPAVDPARGAVIAGNGIGGLQTLEEQHEVYLTKGPARVSPFLIPMMMPNATAGHVSMHLGWTGPNMCISTACASGTHAVGEATRLIREGTSDIVLTGGVECTITPLAISAFARMGALSSRNDAPELASRPFDVDRDGFVMGEGAGFLVLEEWDHAIARGARVYGEIIGYGRSADAHHITAPAPGGAGAVACMQLALEDSGLAPSGIGHINAHGTSTPLNDAGEAEAILKVFGESAPPVTSIKGATGHLIAAAGAVEAVATALAFHRGQIPPTANHVKTDPEIHVDVVAGSPRETPPGACISNSFGFGGHNASVIIAPTG